MFGLGTWEIILILVAALIFIGPDKLPQVAKTIGKGLRQVRNAMSQVDAEVRKAADDFVRSAEDDEDEDEDKRARRARRAGVGPEVAQTARAEAPPPAPGWGGLGVTELPEQAPPTALDEAAPDGEAPATHADGPPVRDWAAERDWTSHTQAPVPGRVAAVASGRGAGRATRVVDVPPPPPDPPAPETPAPPGPDTPDDEGTAT